MHTPPPACPGPLQDIFPDSFTQLVRVYNHKAVDKLLSQHEAAASHRDRCVTALAAARGKADAAQGKGGAAKAAARLERAEAELAKAEERVGELEGAGGGGAPGCPGAAPRHRLHCAVQVRVPGSSQHLGRCGRQAQGAGCMHKGQCRLWVVG